MIGVGNAAVLAIVELYHVKSINITPVTYKNFVVLLMFTKILEDDVIKVVDIL